MDNVRKQLYRNRYINLKLLRPFEMYKLIPDEQSGVDGGKEKLHDMA